MIFIGIDPGSSCTGLAVLQMKSKNVEPSLLALDYYESKARTFDLKILEICEQVEKTYLEFEPDFLSLEQAFAGKNIQSALRLAELRGAISYLALKNKIQLEHFPTRVVKKSITGNGNAKKEQVASFLLNEFNLKDVDVPLDATDALALAYHHTLLWKKPEFK